MQPWFYPFSGALLAANVITDVPTIVIAVVSVDIGYENIPQCLAVFGVYESAIHPPYTEFAYQLYSVRALAIVFMLALSQNLNSTSLPPSFMSGEKVLMLY